MRGALTFTCIPGVPSAMRVTVGCDVCGSVAGSQLCDAPVGGGTCDAQLCRGCAQRLPDGRDLCPKHRVGDVPRTP